MKTISDLNALIPLLTDLLRKNNHKIGEFNGAYWSDSGNYVYYEDNGWFIEISYSCFGDWDNDPGDYWTAPSSTIMSAKGEITDIYVYHYDEKRDEETEFSESNLNELRTALNEVLENI